MPKGKSRKVVVHNTTATSNPIITGPNISITPSDDTITLVMREPFVYPYPETREDHLSLLKLLNSMGIDCGKLEVIIGKI